MPFSAGASERSGPRRDLRLGRGRLHYREGQDYRETRQDEDGLGYFILYVLEWSMFRNKTFIIKCMVFFPLFYIVLLLNK